MLKYGFSKKRNIMLLLGLFFVLAMIWKFIPPQEQTLSNEFTHEEGYAWSVDIPLYKWFSDSMTFPQMSPLRLFENGVPLAASHCSHKTVKIEGMGCYSHWGGKIYFSASDNSNPNQNGRVYEIKYSYSKLTETAAFKQISFVIFSGSVVCSVLFVCFARLGVLRFARVSGYVCIVLAAVILVINVYGAILGRDVYPQNPTEIRENKKTEFIITSVDSLFKRGDESYEGYFERISKSVYDHMILAWKDEYTQIPLEENYILFLLSYLAPDRFSSIELVDPELALERRYSICSQSALVVYQILNKQNIPTKMVGLDGHVVASAKDQTGKEFVLDPYVGITIPYSMGEIEKNPLLVKSYYDQFAGEESGYGDFMAGYYEKDGNNIYDITNDYLSNSLYVEEFSYYMKWMIPAFLLFLGSSLVVFCNMRKKMNYID